MKLFEVFHSLLILLQKLAQLGQSYDMFLTVILNGCRVSKLRDISMSQN